MFEKSELEEKTRDDLVQLAEDHGMTVKARATKAELVAMLTGEDASDEADASKEPAEEEPAEEESLSDAEKAAESRGRERVTIRIHSGDDDSDVKVGVNGKMYQIKRDTEVEVPRAVLNVLERAVETRMEPAGQNEDGSVHWRDRKARRFAFDIR
ncbi:MAG: hypothetical protein ACOCUJ_01535 [Thiohalospira sp.]